MTIQECASKLQNLLDANFKPGSFTVGHDQNQTIVVYEHRRGFAKRRVRPEWIPIEFNVEYKYVGKLRLA